MALHTPASAKATGADPTALLHQVGPQKTSRADFAYTVATDLLARWSE
jgi:hypothetical protein